MDKIRFMKSISVAVILVNILLISGCSQILNASVGMEKAVDEENRNASQGEMGIITDTDRETLGKDPIVIDLSKLKEPMSGEGFSYEMNCLRITEGGSYLLQGKTENCSLIIQAYDDEIVHLILENAEITSPNAPAVYAESADKVVISVTDETESILSDGAEYASDGEACIFSNCDLTINGSGTLNVYGYYHDAIRSKDRLKVIETNLSTRSKNDGLRGNDEVLIQDSTVRIESEGTGILTNSDFGSVMIQGGSCNVISGENAIYADSYVSVKDCQHDFYAVQEAVRCNGIKEIEEDK